MSVATNLTAELEPVRAMLAADGYALAAALSSDGRTIVLDITATADACAECLAPPTVIAAVARSCFSESSALAAARSTCAFRCMAPPRRLISPPGVTEKPTP